MKETLFGARWRGTVLLAEMGLEVVTRNGWLLAMLSPFLNGKWSPSPHLPGPWSLTLVSWAIEDMALSVLHKMVGNGLTSTWAAWLLKELMWEEWWLWHVGKFSEIGLQECRSPRLEVWEWGQAPTGSRGSEMQVQALLSLCHPCIPYCSPPCLGH